MFKKILPWAVFCAAMFILFGYYFGNYSITINGEEIHGLQGVAFATGGLFVAGLAVVGAMILVALVLAGASMVLAGLFAFFFLGMLCIFSPVWVPVAVVAIGIAFVFRKRKGGPPANKRCW